MEMYQGAFVIIAVCGILFFIIAVKSNSHLIINLLLRSLSGSIMIFFINKFLESSEIFALVGLNLGTVLTAGILGFPGVVLLFGIKLYGLL